MPVAEDVTGRRFGRLTALHRDRAPERHKHWFFRCDCGNERSMFLASVKRGDSKSCGCLRAERTRQRSLIHGHSVGYKVTPTRRSYAEAKSRCTNPSDPLYGKYGAVGVQMSERWATSFAAFLEDMGARPPGSILARLDKSGHYEPSNCLWRPRRTKTTVNQGTRGTGR